MIIDFTNLFLSTSNSNLDFDLADLLTIVCDLKNLEHADFEIRLFAYEYNGVKCSWESINPNIIHFLEQDKDSNIVIKYSDFLKFAQFIGQTESGLFQVITDAENACLTIEVYDSYFWKISSNDKSLINDLYNHKMLQNFSLEIS